MQILDKLGLDEIDVIACFYFLINAVYHLDLKTKPEPGFVDAAKVFMTARLTTDKVKIIKKEMGRIMMEELLDRLAPEDDENGPVYH